MSFISSASAPRWRILAAFFCIYILWGGSFLAIRYALDTLPTFMISAVRFTCAGLILIALVRRTGTAMPTVIHWRSAALLGFVMFFLANGALVIAEHSISTGLAATLYATLPFWVALLGWLWQGEARPDRRMLAGLGLGFAGIVLMFNLGAVGGGLNPVGGLLVLFSAFSWGLGSLLSRRVSLPPSTLLASGMNVLCAGLMFWVLSLVSGEFAQLNPATVSLRSLLSVVYLILGSSVLAFSAYMWLLNVTTPNRVATYAYINPVVALLLGGVLAGESLTPNEVLAAAVIIGAVVLLTTAKPLSPNPFPRVQGKGSESRSISHKNQFPKSRKLTTNSQHPLTAGRTGQHGCRRGHAGWHNAAPKRRQRAQCDRENPCRSCAGRWRLPQPDCHTGKPVQSVIRHWALSSRD